jgi:2-methylcitrate dehydratase PrpD
MTNTYTRGLAEYIADCTFEVIPQAVVEHAKLLILDTIGAGLLGAALPWSERLRATM